MPCYKCKKDSKVKFYSPNKTSWYCQECFDKLKSVQENQLICFRCGKQITGMVYSSAISNRVFCSRDCLASKYGFTKEG